MSGQISENPILTDLSKVVARSVGSESLQRARLHLLDWIGCAAAGAREPAGRILLQQKAGDDLSLAFAWGGIGNVLEMDDVDKRALLHPGPTIIPAILSIAISTSASVSTILEGIVRGYEATIRLGRAVGAPHYSLFHSTGTCGAIGAAVASASVLKLSTSQTAHAMALAVSQASGLWHTRHDAESMGKQLHTAVAARAGLHAAILAGAGFKGPIEILEGEQGFFHAMCPASDPQKVLEALDANWAIHDVSFKPWPACRHAHAVIDAALELKSTLGGNIPEAINVRTYSDALKFCDKPNPETVIEAKFSLQHVVAIVMLKGAPRLEDFEIAAINAPDISDYRKNVTVSESAELDAVYPMHFAAEVTYGEYVVRVPDALGDPENPMSNTQIRDKAKMLMSAGGVADSSIQTIIDRVLNDEDSSQGLLGQLVEVLA